MQLLREEFVKLLEFGESGLRDTACIESGLQGALYRKTPFVLAIASMTRRLCTEFLGLMFLLGLTFPIHTRVLQNSIVSSSVVCPK